MVPLAVGAYAKHSKDLSDAQREMEKRKADNERLAEAAQLQMLETQRAKAEADAETERLRLANQEAANQAQHRQQQPIVLGPLNSIFHLLAAL